MTKKEYERQLEKIRYKNRQIEIKRNLRKERIKGFPHFKFKKPATSKVALFLTIFITFQIVLFVEYVMLKYGDFSAAYALIGIPATLAPSLIAYLNKSKAENTRSGIVYETAMAQYNSTNNAKDSVDNVDLSDCSDE